MKSIPERGFVLVTMMMLLALLSGLLATYFTVTRIETLTTRQTKDSVAGFYAAEGGLNYRAEQIRARFVGFNRPTGASPTPTNACVGENTGSGDFGCVNLNVGKRTVRTHVVEAAGNPIITTIPPGERYQGLNAQEYRYTARASAFGVGDVREEAILELRFKSRLVPLFQFAAFYTKDLEILPGPTMTLSGPVHTNGDLYLNSDATLTVTGQVTAAGNVYRGRKNTSACRSNSVRVFDPISARQLIPTCSTRTLVNNSDLVPFNNMIQQGVPILTVPEPEVFDPVPGQVYWDKADLRLVLNLDSSGNPVTSVAATGVEVRNSNDTVNNVLTNTLNNATACPGSLGGRAVGNSFTFRNNRENKFIRMLEVDMQALLNCIHNNNLLATGVGPYNPALKRLSDDTEGGLVFHMTVKGPQSDAAANPYGIRIRNGANLRSSVAGAPVPRGMSIISDQAAYVLGDFNSVNKLPAAIMVDSFNVLSNAWNTDARSTNALGTRAPSNTTINSALVSGTDTTGGVEGAGGQGGAYNGGLENYPRFHENWNGTVTFTYRGSFVSLGRPRHVNGGWVYGGTVYTAPVRNWNYDTAFNDAAYLPPITPRFVYLRQELFVRDFERG
jgi:hypothetical protein